MAGHVGTPRTRLYLDNVDAQHEAGCPFFRVAACPLEALGYASSAGMASHGPMAAGGFP